MEEQESTQIVPIPSPWRDVLLQAISQVQEELFIICPYIKEEVVTALKTTLQASQGSRPADLRVRVITRVNGDELLAGSSDLSALQQFLRWPRELSGSSVELRAIPNIHAKVWIIDDARAIVGSGNATPSGLDENLEYGLAVTDPVIVARVRQDWESWWNQAERVNAQQLEDLQERLTRHSQQLQEIEKARREILRTLGPTPRIGRHLTPRTRQSTSTLASSTEPALSRVAEDRQVYTTREIITAPPVHLRAALQWVYPFRRDRQAPNVTLPEREFIKLTWDRDALQLTFTWANGQRRSEASIPARRGDTGTSWAITLDLDSAQSIVSHLVQWERAARWGGSAGKDPQLSLSYWITHWNLEIQRGSRAYTGIRVTQTNPPPAFPHLQAPISRLTSIEHQALQDVLAQQPASAETTWFRLARAGSIVSLTFSASLSDNPAHVISLPATQSQLAGPPIVLQLATADLQQAILRDPTIVNRWSIEIDRDAKAMQLVPEVDNEVVGRWRHHLWHVEG